MRHDRALVVIAGRAQYFDDYIYIMSILFLRDSFALCVSWITYEDLHCVYICTYIYIYMHVYIHMYIYNILIYIYMVAQVHQFL